MVDNTATLGLTTPEIAWLRQNQSRNDTARFMTNLYNLVTQDPRDSGARELFKSALLEWRRSVNDGDKPRFLDSNQVHRWI